MRVFYDEDADPQALQGDTVAILGYGIQGRAQALNLRDSGVRVLVGNREDLYKSQALADGMDVTSIEKAAGKASLIVLLLPDELQPEIYRRAIEPGLEDGKALVFAHGFAVHYGLIVPPSGVDVLLLAPRMPGEYVRKRYQAGWGVPAFVGVHQDASGRAERRLLGLARALGVTRCAAIEVTFAQETELDHFSEHFTYPLIFRALEIAFEFLVKEGYPPELALMELHGSEEIGQVLSSAAREGLFPMLDSHASPACRAGIAHYWERVLGPREEWEQRARTVMGEIREGRFARHLVRESESGYPELTEWRGGRSQTLEDAERSLRERMRSPDA